MLDNRLRTNLTFFHYDMNNQQLTAVGGGANFNRLINADRTTGDGVELDIDAYVTDRLLVTVGGSFNDTEIHDRNLTTQICGAPCTVTDPTVVVDGVTLAKLDGNRLPQAPRWVANTTARYGIPMGDGAEVFIYTDWAYRSKVNFFLYNSPEFTGGDRKSTRLNSSH